jgi:hypothetical protein
MIGNGPRLAGRALAVLALVALVAGVSMAVRQWSARPAPPHPVTLATDPREGMPHDSVHAAFRQGGVDDDEKSRWRDEVPGADVAALTPERREIFLRLVNTRRCTCGCGYTLAACRAYDTSCEKSLPKVTALLDSVSVGRITDVSRARVRPATASN